MAVFNYKKYKISLAPNSCKTQGLRVGDIVRRQYFDNQLEQVIKTDAQGNPVKDQDGNIVKVYTGKHIESVYNLMCVLETGESLVDQLLEDGTPVLDETGNPVKFKQPWFIGALIDGVDSPPQQGQVLDFARVTSLFDTDRSGALYLTASDDQAPYMDVIDGIGRNESLCWPEDICQSSNPDCETQYYLQGTISGDYTPYDGNGHNRVLHVVRESGGASFTGIQQDFYKYVSNPNMVLVSYKARASAKVRAGVTLGYVNDSKSDTENPIEVQFGNEWKYYFHAITVDWSGRHLRTLKMNLGSMHVDEEVWISDFNIILLSSVANFKDASKTRIGRLDGVVDPVFGRLEGYGGYLQKLFASQSAHISGTLTAGDENGFGSSFYAGKIHKNVLRNSLGLNTVGGVLLSTESSPTGVGNTIRIQSATSLIIQENEWLYPNPGEGESKVGKTYTFSFWAYSKKPCVIDLLQNGKSLGAIYINILQTHQWVRLHKTFEIKGLEAANITDQLIMTIQPTFKEVSDVAFGNEFKNDKFTNPDDIADDTQIQDEDELLFSAPQFESGSLVTQYQPTDDVLNYTEDYGAWFNRGGIGGTIQNPLLRLNYDGKGGIATCPTGPNAKPSLALNQDGSGHVAQGKISWDEQGDVTFDKNVHLNWDNLGDDTQQEIVSKSIRIIGTDTFTLLGDATGATPTTDPADITLSLEEENISSGVDNRKWQYLKGYEWVDFPKGKNNGKTLTIFPFNDSPDYWNDSNKLTVRCLVVMDKGTKKEKTYSDTFTIRKQLIAGYTIEITSSNGTGFKNNDCSTILTANVYYQGKLVDPTYCQQHYVFKWVKYDMVDGEPVEDESFWGTPGTSDYIDPTKQQITIDYNISGSDYFTCEMMLSPGFPYDFPIYF